MINISDLFPLEKNKCSKTRINYSLFLMFFGSLLVSSTTLVPKLSKKHDFTFIMGNPNLLYQSTIICKAYNESPLSTFSNDKYSYNTASFLNLTFISDLFSTINRFIPVDTIKRMEAEKYLSILEKDKFKGSRTARWYYGWFIFKDYPWYNKIVGGGFDYLEMYGTKFGVTKYDYPHNPFISAFLYSGIIGGLFYIWFMILVFWYYIKYMKHHMFFFICFLVVFFFSFVSANTHFSVPIFAIFCIIPFLTKFLVEKEKLLESKYKSNKDIT